MKCGLSFGMLVLMYVTFAPSTFAESNSIYRIINLHLLKNQRITSFEIDIKAGGFDGVSHLPMGWTIVVDNDASWSTKLQASATVGAAALSEEALKNIIFDVEKNEFGDLKFQLSGSVVFTSDFTNEGTFPLKSANFSKAR